ncbi:hypothetical protein ALP8811_00686 [Aliiroseovarius pelagivivens]|uniref:Outer membrane protein beta-barrel domain-containing protein n=2 Tax=Aliiroseovarius pelagivivens TaxID=1639690 RepID=A0A2R8AI23_9RHOB|nr:hypothetical protein ALP8811_00686 [Aliiroseovarius pelagivivens]
MMKSASLVTCLTVLIATGHAHAGSLHDPVIETPVTAFAVEDLKPWHGAYIGGTIGHHFSGGDQVGIDPTSGSSFDVGDFDISGWTGSLRAGYRWQFSSFVIGGELAVEGGPVEDAFRNGDVRGSTKLNHALSFRVKAGSVWRVWDSFVYGTVGVTRAEFDYNVTSNNPIRPLAIDETYSTNGYILGLGFERPISDRWTLTGEYEYTNFGTDKLTGGNGNSTLATPLFHTVKLGVNYNF